MQNLVIPDSIQFTDAADRLAKKEGNKLKEKGESVAETENTTETESDGSWKNKCKQAEGFPTSSVEGKGGLDDKGDPERAMYEKLDIKGYLEHYKKSAKRKTVGIKSNKSKTKENMVKGEVRCGRCKIPFPSQGEYCKHYKRIHEVKRCAQCSKALKGAAEMSRHLAHHRKGKIPKVLRSYKCYECDSKFRSKTKLNGHLLTHHNHVEVHIVNMMNMAPFSIV